MRRRTMLLAVALIALALPFQLGTSALTTATFVVIAAIGATGLNVLTGYAGQISLGHAFFLAVGAYTGAKLGEDARWSAALWIPAAGVVAGLCGALVGPVALRLRGLYLAIVTLGLVFIGQHVFFNAESLTGGPQGRTFPPVVIGPFDFSPGQVLRLGPLRSTTTGSTTSSRSRCWQPPRRSRGTCGAPAAAARWSRCASARSPPRSWASTSAG